MSYLLHALAPVAAPGDLMDPRLPLTGQPGVDDMLGEDDDDLLGDVYGDYEGYVSRGDVPLTAAGMYDDADLEDDFGEDDDLLGDLDFEGQVDLAMPASAHGEPYYNEGIPEYDDDVLGGDDLDDLLGADVLDETDDDLLGAELDDDLGADVLDETDDDLLGAEEEEDQMGILPYIAVAVSAGALSRVQQRRLIRAMPYMHWQTLRKIANNRWRRRWVRNKAREELARRRAGGRRLQAGQRLYEEGYEYQDQPNYWQRRGQFYPHTRRQGRSTETWHMPGVRTQRTMPPTARTTMTRPTRTMTRPTAKPAKPTGAKPGWRIRQQLQQRKAIHEARKAARGARNELVGPAMGDAYGYGPAPAGYDLTPKLGSAMWAHPVKTAGLAAAVFGVGAVVGYDRVLDTASSLVNAVTGLFRG